MKNKKAIIMIVIVSILVFISVAVFALVNSKTISVFSNNIENIDIFEGMEFKEAKVEKYTVYGTHLNLDIKAENIEEIKNIFEAKLLFKNSKGQDLEYNLDYKLEDTNILFFTSSNINTGINLEDIDVEEYYSILKISTKELVENEEVVKYYYYNIVNNTEYDNVEYYTITREESNKKIDISFSKIPNKDINTLYVLTKECKLPEDVYDIVIDAGHGGTDEGTSGNGYTESEVTLEYALMLKKKFEKLGLKVKLTRDNNDIRMDTYGEGGRYVIANEVKAKLLLSVHLNSSIDSSVCGVEIYSPNNSDLTFPKNLAKSLVENVNSSYSPNNVWKEEDGVYVRTFSDEEMRELIEYANDGGFEPYKVSNNTSYYGVIREAGGIMTGAYVDGRNPNYGNNPYYNLNIGVETYLLELGYITNKDELSNILSNIKTYTDLIVLNTKEYLEL